MLTNENYISGFKMSTRPAYTTICQGGRTIGMFGP